MKRIFMILVAVILTASVFAQTPQAMSYQAVIRNSESKLVKNQEVGMQISILQGTADGTAVYVETHKPTTNANGLVTVEIGGGTVISGDFTAIDWSADKYFVKTETDPAGGTAYTVTGTSQLLSVPYALHAKTAESVKGGITESDPVFTAWDKSYNDLADKPTLSTVATSGSYNDLADKPTLSTVATSGSYNDLTDKPTTISTAQADAITTNTAKNTYPTADKTKLQGIQAGAEVNVQADWNATSGDAQILNKPTIPAEADGSETKVTAGTNVTVTGAGTAASPYVIGATSGSSYYVGQLIGTNGEDGVVFYVDETGQHGLICSKADIDGGSGVAWSNIISVEIGATAKSEFNGDANTNAIIGQASHTSSAAKLCADYSTNGTSQGDWYLPAIDELSLIYHAKYQINKALNTNSFALTSYWSSTEYYSSDAWSCNFGYGGSGYYDKNYTYRVRAVRAF